MKQTKRRILAWLMTVVLVLSVVTVLTPAKEAEAAAATAVSTHGKLAVKGTQLVDKNGQPFQIHGVSTHGLQWFGQYNNKAAYQTLRDDWGANAIRLAMYVDEGGYYSDRNGMKKKVTDGVQYATELGMYAIIDWHLLNVNPKNYTSEARSFFKEMAQKYKNYDNVIYEICNEPSNCPWSDIKSYATEVIQTIRAYDKDAIIIVGTPTWSQLGNQGHTYEPADDPIRGYSNLMYAFHFYASESSHNQWLTAKIGTAIDKGLPVFVSEFGLSEASGNGNVDLNKAAELKYGKLPQLQKELEEEEKLAEQSKSASMLHDKVTEEEIAKIICRWTGIPVSKLMEGEREKLLHMEDILHKRVIGQDEAVEKVSEAILRSRAGIANPDQPIGSFLFLGPTGVGKTELAKALAEALFDDEHSMVRIDMSEYMEKFSVSRLIGAPPGYVGYEEGGQLTEAVRRKPYSVVLLDEVEKAHPDVFNILLQILDDGRITDSQGRTVDFKNTIIILTSNLGSSYILDGINDKGEISEEAKNEVNKLLKTQFRPEFLNRLDEIVFYKPLRKDEISGIVDLMLGELKKRLADKEVGFAITDAAKDYVINNGFDPNYGARPLKRFIQRKIETLIARKLIADDVAPGSTLTVDYDGEKLICSES